MSHRIFVHRSSSKYRLLLIVPLALLVYVSQISVQGMSPREVTPDQEELTRSASIEGTGGVQNLDMSNAGLSFTQQASTCPGDFDDNGMINFADFLLFVGVFGTSSDDANYNALMDMDGNGEIDFADFLSFVGVFGTTCETPPSSTSDRAALVALYNATDGPNWKNNTNWLTDAPLDDWYGVDTDDFGRVVRLDLSSERGSKYNRHITHGLSGQIPPEIGNLTSLMSLNLSGNNLTGSIPPELGNLSNLQELFLWKNSLRGKIPSQLAGLNNLRILKLRENDLSGSIPPELGNLSNLRYLDLGQNNLIGSIPSEFGNLVNLQHLTLSGKNLKLENLTGSIPPELGNLTSLTWLDLSGNNLTGSIPSELGNLANLEVLDIYGNNLSGPIPSRLSKLPLRFFRWFDNISLCVPGTTLFAEWVEGMGTAEGTFCNASDKAALESLFETAGGSNWTNAEGWLGSSALSVWRGVLTDSLGRVTELNLSRNGLAGYLPMHLGRLKQLTELRIAGNNGLSGHLPPSLSGLSLQVLHYSGTELCTLAKASFRAWLSTIPSHQGTGAECVLSDRDLLVGLYDATIGQNWRNKDNWLTDAPLREWYGVNTDDQGKVVSLNLISNNLSGSFPPELGGFANLRSLHLNGNADFSGQIPPEIGNLTNLEELILSGCQLSGQIPPEIGNLTNLHILNLSGTDLVGQIPPEIGNLTNLEHLFISGRNLSGQIPPEIGNLTNLKRLYFSGNSLSGPLPPEIGNLTNLQVLNLEENFLSGSIPPEIGNLTNLIFLNLDDNDLSEPIPPEIGNLTNLQVLNLVRNDLSGSIPPEIGNLTNLMFLNLSGNDLFGPLPHELGDLTRLRELVLSGNASTFGGLPTSLTNLRSLEQLQATGTGLCAPSAPVFSEWLESIPIRRVTPCDEPPPAYLTQAVQSRDFPVPLVAGKEALLRVFVTASRANEERIPPIRASFYLNGVIAYVAEIASKAGPIPTEVDEGSLATSASALIPATVVRPSLEMVIEIDPDGTLDPELSVAKRIPETNRQRIDVRTMPIFDLTIIPFLWEQTPDASILESIAGMAADPENHELLRNTRALLPVGGLKVTAHEPVLTSSRQLLPQTEAIRAMEGGTGHYMGTMSPASLGFQGGGIAQLGGWSSQAALESPIIAHELGHNMSLQHAPCGGAGNPDPTYPYSDGDIGAWGYDFSRSRLVPPSRPDLMSYCDSEWVSDYHFDKALRFRLADEDASAATVAPTPATSLLLWGGIDTEENPYLEPTFVVNAPPALPQYGGQYRLTGRDAIRTELFSLAFDMPEVVHGDGSSSFAFVIPVRPEWKDNLASITLTGPGGSTTLDNDTDRPMVILRNPRTGQVRGFLRDLPEAALARGKITADALSPEPDLEALFSRGIPSAEAY